MQSRLINIHKKIKTILYPGILTEITWSTKHFVSYTTYRALFYFGIQVYILWAIRAGVAFDRAGFGSSNAHLCPELATYIHISKTKPVSKFCIELYM